MRRGLAVVRSGSDSSSWACQASASGSGSGRGRTGAVGRCAARAASQVAGPPCSRSPAVAAGCRARQGPSCPHGALNQPAGSMQSCGICFDTPAEDVGELDGCTHKWALLPGCLALCAVTAATPRRAAHAGTAWAASRSGRRSSPAARCARPASPRSRTAQSSRAPTRAAGRTLRSVWAWVLCCTSTTSRRGTRCALALGSQGHKPCPAVLGSEAWTAAAHRGHGHTG